MARIVEFRSSEQPHMSVSESRYYRLAEPLIFRDLDGVLGDIVAACCRRCGEVTLRSEEVANHLCTSSERTEQLIERGMKSFRAIEDERDRERARADRAVAALEELQEAGRQMRDVLDSKDEPPSEAVFVLQRFLTLIERDNSVGLAAEGQSSSVDFRAAVTQAAVSLVVDHPEPGVTGRSWSCVLCGNFWDEDAPARHAPGCPLAAPAEGQPIEQKG